MMKRSEEEKTQEREDEVESPDVQEGFDGPKNGLCRDHQTAHSESDENE